MVVKPILLGTHFPHQPPCLPQKKFLKHSTLFNRNSNNKNWAKETTTKLDMSNSKNKTAHKHVNKLTDNAFPLPEVSRHKYPERVRSGFEPAAHGPKGRAHGLKQRLGCLGLLDEGLSLYLKSKRSYSPGIGNTVARQQKLTFHCI